MNQMLILTSILSYAFIDFNVPLVYGVPPVEYYLPVVDFMGDISSYICTPVSKLELEFTCYDIYGLTKVGTKRTKMKINECIIKGPYSRSDNISFCHIKASDTVMVSVMVSRTQSTGEAYMAVPGSHWGNEYLIVRVLGFAFIVLFTFTDVDAKWLYDVQDNSKEYTPITISRNDPYAIDTCVVYTGMDISNSIFVATVVISEGKIGAVAGVCRYADVASEVIIIETIESMKPEGKNQVHEFITFCSNLHECTTVVFSGPDTTFKLVDIGKREAIHYWRYDGQWVFKFSQKHLRITSESSIFVMVYMSRDNKIFECQALILPWYLHNNIYVWRPLKVNTKHYMVLISDLKWSSFQMNFTSISTHYVVSDMEGLHRSVLYVLLSNTDIDDVFSISSTQSFGCYAYGYDANNESYALPVGLAKHKQTDEKTTQKTTVATCVVSEMKLGDKLDNDCDGFVDEEIRNARDDDTDGEVDEDCALDTENACLPNWYGTDCSRMCFCQQSKCKPDGSCQENVTCLKGYFGDQCQNKDYVAVANVSHKGMQYRSYFKCQEYFKAVNFLTIDFTDNVMLKWVQIDAVSIDHLANIALKFESLPGKDSCYSGECLSPRNVYADNNTLFIYCDTKFSACRLKIIFADGKKSRDVCAVFVGGGRNIALYKPTFMSSYYDNHKGFVSRGFLSVDGSINEDEKACATTRKDDMKASWMVTFPSPVVIYSILIYFRVIQPGRFIGTLYDDRNMTLQYFSSDLKKIYSTAAKTSGHVKRIEIFSTQAGVPLSICEFLAYGECAPPTYGPDCTDICSITCDDQICSYEGYCRSCPNKTSGPYCFEGCLEWCEDYADASTNVTVPSLNLTTTDHTSPHHHYRHHDTYRDLFRIEHVWYYPIMLTTLLIVVCCAVVKAPGKKSDNQNVSEPKVVKDHKEKEDGFLEPSLQDEDYFESVFRSSTSVDISVIKVMSKVHSTAKFHSSMSSIYPPATQDGSPVPTTETTSISAFQSNK